MLGIAGVGRIRLAMAMLCLAAAVTTPLVACDRRDWDSERPSDQEAMDFLVALAESDSSRVGRALGHQATPQRMGRLQREAFGAESDPSAEGIAVAEVPSAESSSAIAFTCYVNLDLKRHDPALGLEPRVTPLTREVRVVFRNEQGRWLVDSVVGKRVDSVPDP